jgi:hypothetical protein
MARKPTQKTAGKTATPSPLTGKALPVGAHPGNTGGKKGRSGRKPDEFKAFMRSLVSHEDASSALHSVLVNPKHPHWVQAFKMAAEFGYGRASQPLEHTGEGGGPISVSITHTVVDPSPNAG